MKSGDYGQRCKGGDSLEKLKSKPQTGRPSWVVACDGLDVASHCDLRDAEDGEKAVDNDERPRGCRWSSMEWDREKVELWY